jgi:hypothetical protein
MRVWRIDARFSQFGGLNRSWVLTQTSKGSWALDGQFDKNCETGEGRSRKQRALSWGGVENPGLRIETWAPAQSGALSLSLVSNSHMTLVRVVRLAGGDVSVPRAVGFSGCTDSATNAALALRATVGGDASDSACIRAHGPMPSGSCPAGGHGGTTTEPERLKIAPTES